MNNSAIVIGIKGTLLNKIEKDYLKTYKPVGAILFKRNISDKQQTISLVNQLKLEIGPNAIIMIDQEGGRVSRLDNKLWPSYPAANFFGKLAQKNLNLAKKETFNNFYSIGKELEEMGINYNCAPVLDLLIKKSSKVIGDRAFSRDPNIVSMLGLEACKGLIKAKVKPVIKHIPGHGKSKEDSHLKLPIIEHSISRLEEDFLPFRKLQKAHSAMTAHIKYKKLDNINCATQSKYIINEIIKKQIGFSGILFSDDLCMKALKGPYFLRAKKAIEAGCDVVLHCEPNIQNIIKSTEGAGTISNQLKKKLYE